MRRIARQTGAVGLLLALAAPACRTVPPMAEFGMTGSPLIGYSYRAGVASQSFSSPEPEVLEAALAAMEDLSMQTIREPKRSGTATSLVAQAADGRRVRVDLKPQGSSTTASVQVGLIGDEPLSRAFLDRLGIRLGTLPPRPLDDEEVVRTDGQWRTPVLSRDGVPDSVMYRGFTDSDFNDSPVP